MARMRTLKPEACASESLAAVPREVRWTFATLWTHCDDNGRAVNNPRLIKAALYPLDDDVTAQTVEDEVNLLAATGHLCLYEVDGKQYLHVVSFGEHQHPNRPVESKLPACPHATHGQLTEPAVSQQGALTPVVVVGEVDGGGVVEEKRASRTKRGTRIAPDWRPDDELRTWTLQHIDQPTASRELEKFRNYWASKTRDATKLDWAATWRNWVITAAERQPSRASPKRGTTDERVAGFIELSNQFEAAGQ